MVAATVLALAALIAPASATATPRVDSASSATVGVGDFEYELFSGSPNRATLTGWSGARKTSIVIPATITVAGTVYQVTTIGYGAFSGPFSYDIPNVAPKPATSATIPEGVKAIEDFAFYGNRITEFIIPSTVTSIGRQALWQDYHVVGGVKSPLRSVTFLGNAPQMDELGRSVCLPSGCDYLGEAPLGSGNNLIVYYSPGKSGWSTPIWGGYLAAPVGTHPLVTGYQPSIDYMFTLVSPMPVAGSTRSVKLSAWGYDAKISPKPSSTEFRWELYNGPGDWTVLGTGKSMAIPADAAGKPLRVLTILTGPGDRKAVVQLGAALVVRGEFTATPAVSIVLPGGVSEPTAGDVLSAPTLATSAFTPAADSVTYQWYRSGKAVSGRTGSTYTVSKSDHGKKVTVQVTGTKYGYVDAVVKSAPVSVPKVFAKTKKVSISGSLTVGSKVKAKWSGTWSPKPKVAYEWTVGGTVVSTKSSYVIQPADQGKPLVLTITATKSGYRTVVKTAGPVTVLREFATAPVPDLTLDEGGVLRVSPGTWEPEATITYQWYRGSTKIRGATTETYVPKKADRGKKIRVRVTAARDGYRTTSVYSIKVSVSKSGTILAPSSHVP